MRCFYCHDRVMDDWIELQFNRIAHTECALLVWSRHQIDETRQAVLSTVELTCEDAQEIILAWEERLAGP